MSLRSTLRLTPSALLVAILVLMSVPASSFGAKKINFDRSFGSNGHATVGLPRGTDFDFSNDTANSALGGLRGSWYVFGELVSGHQRAAGGIIFKFNSHGRLDRTFGGDGKVRVTGSHRPVRGVAMEDGSILVISELRKPGGSRYWTVSRRNKSGRLSTTFGINGYLTFKDASIPDEDGPGVFALDRSRFTVLTAHNPSDYSQFTLTAYGRDGRVDRSFGSSGAQRLPMWVTSIATDKRKRLVLGGSSGNNAVVAKLSDSGVPDATWGVAGFATVTTIPEWAWRSSPKSKDTYPKDSSASRVSVQPIGDRVRLTADNKEWDDSGASGFGWAAQFDAAGALDLSWGRGGGAWLGSSDWPDEGGVYSYGKYIPLPDGRILVLQSDVDTDYGDATTDIYVTTPNGATSGSSVREARIPTVLMQDLVASRNGRYALAFTERKGRYRISRYKL